MDAPIESLPAVARERLETIEKRMAEHGEIETKNHVASLLEKFFLGLPFWLQKDIGDAETFVIEFFERDQAWIDQASRTLFDEAQKTSRAAIEAQMKSAFGKGLPDDFAFSQNQLAMMRIRARESAESIAKTYNERLPVWIRQIEDEWREKHGSLKGLNRWTMIKEMGRKNFDFASWKDKQIATTEFSNQWADATQSFWEENDKGLELEFYLAPDYASSPEIDSEPICQEYINRWLTKEEAYLMPAHVSCIHFISETRVGAGQIPITLRLGDSLYMIEDL